MRTRHWLTLASFVLVVLAPTLVAAWYLWTRAADQYASTVGFSVRREDTTSALDVLGSIARFSASSSSDADILYEYLRSQKVVADIDAKLDLRAMWAKAGRSDPVFTLQLPATIEDLHWHWWRMVNLAYDSVTGIIEVRVLAFDPADATAIARELHARSTQLINDLSAIAREDAIRYARDELDTAVERLKIARAALTEFRNRTQIVDPTVDLQTQAGLLGGLQRQLAEALIELDVLRETTRPNDPRIEQAARRVRVIEDRIAAERRKLGIGDATEQGEVFASLVGEFERLQVDREFAEQAYKNALSAYDGALSEARRQSRYLAAHILPTTAERAEYPRRFAILGLGFLFLLIVWSITTLVAYSVKDRR
jgi:capsular polysaccharide transport system permease protein